MTSKHPDRIDLRAPYGGAALMLAILLSALGVCGFCVVAPGAGVLIRMLGLVGFLPTLVALAIALPVCLRLRPVLVIAPEGLIDPSRGGFGLVPWNHLRDATVSEFVSGTGRLARLGAAVLITSPTLDGLTNGPSWLRPVKRWGATMDTRFRHSIFVVRVLLPISVPELRRLLSERAAQSQDSTAT